MIRVHAVRPLEVQREAALLRQAEQRFRDLIADRISVHGGRNTVQPRRLLVQIPLRRPVRRKEIGYRLVRRQHAAVVRLLHRDHIEPHVIALCFDRFGAFGGKNHTVRRGPDRHGADIVDAGGPEVMGAAVAVHIQRGTPRRIIRVAKPISVVCRVRLAALITSDVFDELHIVIVKIAALHGLNIAAVFQ